MHGDADARLAAIVRRVLRLGDDVTVAGRDLWELGLDSVGAIGLLIEIQDAFHVTFAEHELTTANFASIGSLARVIARHVDEGAG